MRDRSASLMVQAAASGVVDFSQVDPNNNLSILRLELLLQETARRIDEKIAFAGLLRAVALMSTSKVPIVDAKLQNSGEYLDSKLLQFSQALFTQELIDLADMRHREVQAKIAKWEATFGVKIDGPEVAVTARKLQESFEAGNKRSQSDIDEEKFIIERIAARNRR